MSTIRIKDERYRPISEREIAYQQRLNSAALNSERISKINDEMHLYTNSVNIFIGPSGSGKSASALMELIEMLDHNPSIHMVLYVNKAGDVDATFREFKPEIEARVKLVILREVDFVEVSQLVLKYKQLYNDIKDQNLEELITDEQLEEMFNILSIDDFNRESLSTVLLMPDCANSVLFSKRERSKDTPVRNYILDFLLKERRHRDVGYTVILCAQTIRDLPVDIRANTDTWFIFGGYNRHELTIIRQYLPTNLSMDQFEQIYNELAKYQKVIFSKHHRDMPIISR